MERRIVKFDISRALCVLWIVGVWHLSEYCDISVSNMITTNVTIGVLSTFTFISGYFLGKKEIRNKEDASEFVKKRILRIYPLFFLACTSMLIVHYLFQANFIVTVKQYILTLMGLSIIFTPAPYTVWYISMLVLFYALTVIINMQPNLKKKIFVCCVMFLVFVGINLSINVDERLFIYFPIYCLGLILSPVKTIEKLKPFCLIVCSASFVAVSLLSHKFRGGVLLNYVFDMTCACLFIFIALQLGTCIGKIKIVEKPLVAISYASMCAYLFHRQFYGVVKAVVGTFSFPIASISLCAVLIGSFFVQSIYDKLRSIMYL